MISSSSATPVKRISEESTLNSVVICLYLHLAFGAGPHCCAGAWVARIMVGQIAVLRLFEPLKILRLDPEGASVVRAGSSGGRQAFKVVWDA